MLRSVVIKLYLMLSAGVLSLGPFLRSKLEGARSSNDGGSINGDGECRSR